MFLVVFLISGSGFLSLPKADMFSWDAVGIQGGIGRYDASWMFPLIGASAGRFRWYWGDRLAFLTGTELTNVYFSQGISGYEIQSHPPTLINVEIVSPQIGLAFLGGVKDRQAYTRCLLPGSQGLYFFTPRVEISTRVSTLTHTLEEEWSIFNIIRTKLIYMPFRNFEVSFEHCWMPFIYEGFSFRDEHLFHLSICFTLGADIIRW